jgi:hypothetical protein
MNELTNIEIDRSIEQRMAFVLQNKYGQKPKTKNRFDGVALAE